MTAVATDNVEKMQNAIVINNIVCTTAVKKCVLTIVIKEEFAIIN